MVDPQIDDDREPEPPSSEVVKLRAKLDEVMRAYSRAEQDKDDFRRRAEREKERVLEVERGKIALALVEIADQLQLSLEAAAEDSPSDGLAAGVRIIHEGLLRQIEQSGLSRLSTLGAPFDPARHEAVETVPVADPALDGQVVGERRAGYLRGDRVLRPARVSVGKFTEDGNNSDGPAVSAGRVARMSSRRS